MYRTLLLFAFCIVGFSSCTKEDEVQRFQEDNSLTQKQELRNAQDEFLDALSPLRGLSIEELQEIIDSEDPLRTLEKYTQIDKGDLLQKATVFQEKIEVFGLNQTSESKNELTNILMANTTTENSASFMATPCYDTYERRMGLATTLLGICVYGSGGSGAAACLLVYGATALVLDAEFEDCLTNRY